MAFLDITTADEEWDPDERVTLNDIEKARAEHPAALLMAHPECRIEVLEKADHVTSTSGMLRFARSSSSR